MKLIIILLSLFFMSCNEPAPEPTRPTKVVRAQAYWYGTSAMKWFTYDDIRIIKVDTLYKVGDFVQYNGMRHQIIE